MATNLDDRLLSRGDKGGAPAQAGGQPPTDKAAAPGEPKTWEAALADKRLKAIQANKSGTAAAGVVSQLVSPLKNATGKLLKQAWLNLADSFGLTLIWINIHVFLRFVLGEDIFCKLGEEWTMGPAVGENAAVAEASKVSGLVEGMGLAILDLGCLFALLIFIFIVRVVLGVMTLDTDTIKELFSVIWDMLKSFVGLSS